MPQPLERVLHALGESVKRSNSGWTANCPAHDDRSPSLSITEGDGGKVLLHCHAGCTYAEVVNSLGLDQSDLSPPKSTASRGGKPKTPAKPAGRTYPTAAAAVNSLEGRNGKRAGLWTYTDAAGAEVMVVVRFNRSDGSKDFRPVHRAADGWRVGALPKPRPLYKLPDLAAADVVVVCEGEKAADAAHSLGLTATTSAGGSQAAGQTDWSPLAGKKVVAILPDNDEPGRRYAEQVAAALAALNPPADAKIVPLPGLQPKGDVADWIAARGDVSREQMVADLCRLIDAAPFNTTSGRKPAMGWDHPARLAEKFTAEHTVKVVKKSVYVYRGDRYEAVGDETLEDMAWQVCEREAVDEHTHLIQADPKAAVPKLRVGTATALVRAVRSRARLPEETKLDHWIGADRGNVLSVSNGLLSAADRTLLPHSPDWFSLTSLPVAFDPRAGSPARWLKVLGEILEGDEDRIATVQEVFGVCLDRNVTFKHLVALVGEGDNGKSVVLTALRSLLGERNVASTSVRRIAQDRFALHTLHGKLANISGDEGFFESNDESTLKAITGEDLVTFEEKYRSGFADVNRCKTLFSCNTLPRFSDRSEAIWNRLTVVPCNYTVPAEKKNPDLLKPWYWEAELPGLLNWALDGLARYRARGRLTLGLLSVRAGDEARLDAQHHRRFLIENYTFDPRCHAHGQEVYDHYREWMRRQGLERHTLSQPSFLKEIPKVLLGAKTGTRRVDGRVVRVWDGVGVREESNTSNSK